jgi:hypothetical protein
MKNLEKLLSGGDLRSAGNSHLIVSGIKNQQDFDELFKFLFHANRLLVMRAADAIEKISAGHPEYLASKKKAIIELGITAKNKELKWHLAQLFSRLPLDAKEFNRVWGILSDWLTDKSNSKIVRVNSFQSLYELAKQKEIMKKDLSLIVRELERECIPSINARIKKLKFYKD